MKRVKGKVVPVEKIWLSPSEARAYLGVGNDKLKKLRDESKISFVPESPKHYIYDKKSIDNYLKRNLIKAVL